MLVSLKTFNLKKTLLGSGGTSQAVIDVTKFTTSDNVNCPINKFTFLKQLEEYEL